MPTVANYISKARDAILAELPGLPAELADLYTLLALTTGTNTTLQHVHDAWSVWCDQTNPTHRSLIPFAALTAEVQELDRKYADGIRRAAATITEKPGPVDVDGMLADYPHIPAGYEGWWTFR